MEGWIGKTEIEIGADEEGLYFEAGSEEAAWAFIGILSMGSEAAIAYLETRIVTYEEVEVEMGDAEAKEQQGIVTNRIELIERITNLIEGAGVATIEDRDDASMLAIHIVDGLENEVSVLSDRGIGVTSHMATLITCPECDESVDGSRFSGVCDAVVIRCAACEHEARLSEFRTAAAGDGEAGGAGNVDTS
ncbi:hypothetical protein LCGC14_1133450 [marine sediment metagenome]|uniref:Uncharacterized protein n=1 Tax=marine sediment metagenome TaxID=412755 RepID=A0A0F9MNB3_9ZZZZ